jgi:hypothetical protein
VARRPHTVHYTSVPIPEKSKQWPSGLLQRGHLLVGFFENGSTQIIQVELSTLGQLFWCDTTSGIGTFRSHLALV